MDGLSEDFSGLPEYQSRDERRSERRERKFTEHRSNPYRGRRTRILVIGGFTIAVLAILVSLFALYVPTPYLGTSHDALAKSVAGSSARDCRPAGGSWVCSSESGGGTIRYEVKVDWAGCWSGRLMGSGASRGDTPQNISGCVSLIDHLTAG